MRLSSMFGTCVGICSDVLIWHVSGRTYLSFSFDWQVKALDIDKRHDCSAFYAPFSAGMSSALSYLCNIVSCSHMRFIDYNELFCCMHSHFRIPPILLLSLRVFSIMISLAKTQERLSTLW